MTARELITNVEVKLNRLSGNVYLGLDSSEILLHLNEAQETFVRQAVNRKIDLLGEDTLDTKDKLLSIENIRKEKILPVYKLTATNEYFSFSPSDLLQLDKIEVQVDKTCVDVETVSTSNKTIKYFVVPLPISNVSSFEITAYAGASPIYLVKDIVYDPIDAELTEILIDRITTSVNNQNIFDVYWENFNDIYKPNSFIFVYSGDLTITNATKLLNGITENITIENLILPKVKSLEVKNVQAKVMPTEFLYTNESNPFSRSTRNSPNIYVRSGKYFVYLNKFVAVNLKISYYKVPRALDLELNNSTELGATRGIKQRISKMLIDMAVEAMQKALK